MLTPLLVNVEVALPRTVSIPAMSAVDEAESAPAMLRLLANVEEAFAMSPPLLSILKRVCSVLSVKRKKSPAKAAVEEA